MVPPTITHGTVIHAVPDGAYTVLEPIVTIRLDDGTEKELALAQKWPIRVPPTDLQAFPGQRSAPYRPANPGYPFPYCQGRHCRSSRRIRNRKTMTQHQIAKWSDADIIIYIGCGERGNEIDTGS